MPGRMGYGSSGGAVFCSLTRCTIEKGLYSTIKQNTGLSIKVNYESRFSEITLAIALDFGEGGSY